MLLTFDINTPFELESGQVLPQLTIAYQTFGSLNADKSNVVWVCHALTANTDPVSWWPGIVGNGGIVNPGEHFIVCANIIGSCYGSTGPKSINPATGKPWYISFPSVTVRDMVKAHMLLLQHLGIEKIYLLMGGSMGGYQVLEWAVMQPKAIENIFIITTSAAESAWGIAIHATQRLAIEADSSWKDDADDAGAKGLKAARAIGMITYRNYSIMVKNQADRDAEKIDDFKAASYIIYQGEKLVKRFNAQSYWILTRSMDSHNIARGRGGDIKKVLQGIAQKTLVMGINSDILCPVHEQEFLVQNMPNAQLEIIDSDYGHDGFLVEKDKINQALRQWLK